MPVKYATSASKIGTLRFSCKQDLTETLANTNSSLPFERKAGEVKVQDDKATQIRAAQKTKLQAVKL